MTNLEIIRQACIKANPEIIDDFIKTKNGVLQTTREIKLADVLLALDKLEKPFWSIYCNGEFINDGSADCMNIETGIFWDLLHDNLELQSEETINFLAELLTPTKQ